MYWQPPSAQQGRSSGSINEIEHLTFDQQIPIAQVAALQSIAQEISALNPSNTTTRDSDGTVRNGWGFPVAIDPLPRTSR